MKINTKHSQETQSISGLGLPLFARRSVVMKPRTPAGRFVARRYRVDPALADLIANMAGLGNEWGNA